MSLSRRKNKGRSKRTSENQIGQNDVLLCSGCNEYIEAAKMGRHAGQCRRRRAAENEENKAQEWSWLDENRDRDISDVGNLGAEDNISMNLDLIQKPLYDSNDDEDDEDDEDDDEDEDDDDDKDGDAILRNDDNVPPELLVKAGKEGDNLEGKVVLVSKFNHSWMNCLGEEEFDYKKKAPLVKREKRRGGRSACKC